MNRLLTRAAGALAAACLIAAAPAQAAGARIVGFGTDVDGGHDHPLVHRFAGSWLAAYRHADWTQTRFPARADDNAHFSVQVEGAVTDLLYISPKGESSLEVFRNYQQALVAAGMKQVVACDDECAKHLRGELMAAADDDHFAWAKGELVDGESHFHLDFALSFEEAHFLYGVLQRDGRTVHVAVYTSATAPSELHAATTVLHIAEPKAMQGGQVTVDAGAIQGGLADDGRIALYGLYFDTGKAEVKPESKAQLAEMAKVLKAQPALKVMIVGHTDNQGAYAANVALSQKRAEAVVAALARDYGIAGARLQAVGVANASPVASNAQEAGRARNRRVEMVVQ